MGCNCGKNKKAAATSALPQRPRTVSASASARPAGYKLVVGGVSRNFDTRLQADAANARTGNRGVVRQL